MGVKDVEGQGRPSKGVLPRCVEPGALLLKYTRQYLMDLKDPAAYID